MSFRRQAMQSVDKTVARASRSHHHDRGGEPSSRHHRGHGQSFEEDDDDEDRITIDLFHDDPEDPGDVTSYVYPSNKRPGPAGSGGTRRYGRQSSAPPGSAVASPPWYATLFPPGFATSAPPGSATAAPSGFATSASPESATSLPPGSAIWSPPWYATLSPPGYATSSPPGSATASGSAAYDTVDTGGVQRSVSRSDAGYEKVSSCRYVHIWQMPLPKAPDE